MSFLVDTNVISELARPRPDPGVVEWASGVTTISLSVVSVEELFFGLARKPNERILRWLIETLDERCEILPITAETARCSGQLRGQLAARDQVRSQADMLIAATAQIHQRTLATRNVRDFADCGISLLNPFRS